MKLVVSEKCLKLDLSLQRPSYRTDRLRVWCQDSDKKMIYVYHKGEKNCAGTSRSHCLRVGYGRLSKCGREQGWLAAIFQCDEHNRPLLLAFRGKSKAFGTLSPSRLHCLLLPARAKPGNQQNLTALKLLWSLEDPRTSEP